MVSVPVRAAPLSDATVNVTKSSPVAAAPEFTVIQLTAEVAVTGHPAGSATATEPGPPMDENVWVAG
jgi:hypothetical protein